jgi:hypothetical protein
MSFSRDELKILIRKLKTMPYEQIPKIIEKLPTDEQQKNYLLNKAYNEISATAISSPARENSKNIRIIIIIILILVPNFFIQIVTKGFGPYGIGSWIGSSLCTYLFYLLISFIIKKVAKDRLTINLRSYISIPIAIVLYYVVKTLFP